MSSNDSTVQNDATDSRLEQGALHTLEDNRNSSSLKLETPEVRPPAPPAFPDGGRDAWTVVVGAWLAVFVSFGFLNAFGRIFFLLFYLPSYGAIHGFNANMIFYSVSVLNAASFFGRILPGMAADSWGCFNIMIITGFITALLVFVSIAAKNTASILVVGALYGFTSGNVLSLQGACVPPLLDDPRKIGIGIGQILSVSALSALLGPPISGWLIASHGFKSAQIFSGVMLAFGLIMLVVTWALLQRKDPKWIL
ncbi:Riboflavin transporter MCH5 [Leucoagaricus sp. SymC.cos]|nr:Riboflavin transporter MCH5 [Leucoagaricus sp. SymC.cos]